jgi:outer membrane protein OmpA-like peptidoglycan-associated protein
MTMKLALWGALFIGAAVIAFGVGRSARTPDPLSVGVVEAADLSNEASPAEPAPDAAAGEGDGTSGGDNKIARLDAERLRLEAALADAEARADELRAELAAREAEGGAEAQPGTAAADEPEATPDSALAERDTELARLEAALVARDAELSRLASAIEAQGKEIARLSDALAARDAELAKLLDFAKILGVAPQPSLVAATPDADLDMRLEIAKGMPRPRPSGLDRPLFEVHFEMGSARLTPGAEIRSRAAAEALARLTYEGIRVTGHSDTIGSANGNLALSRARAQAVADALVAYGVPSERIEVAALGEDEATLPVRTSAGVAEPLNRCAGIWVTGPRLASN